MVYTTYSWWTWGWFIIVLTTLYVFLIRGQGDDSPNPILIPYSLLYPHIILNPHTAIPIIPKLPYYNIYIYIHTDTYIYIHICIPIIVYIYNVGPCLRNRQVGGHITPQLDGSADGKAGASLWRPAPPGWNQWRCNKQTPELGSSSSPIVSWGWKTDRVRNQLMTGPHPLGSNKNMMYCNHM